MAGKRKTEIEFGPDEFAFKLGSVLMPFMGKGSGFGGVTPITAERGGARSNFQSGSNFVFA